MYSTDFTFESPKQLLEHLANKKQDVIHTPGNFLVWFKKASLWYDANACACRKKNLSEKLIIDGFIDIVRWNDEEKQKVKKIVGGSATFVWDGQVLGSIP